MNAVQKGILYELKVLQILTNHNFTDLKRIGGANDRGIDLIGHYNSKNIMVQCKNENKKTSTSHVRNLEGSLQNHDAIGILVTRLEFSRKAREYLQYSRKCLIGMVIDNEILSIYVNLKTQEKHSLIAAKSLLGKINLCSK